MALLKRSWLWVLPLLGWLVLAVKLAGPSSALVTGIVDHMRAHRERRLRPR